MKILKDKIAVITGAGTGIGKETALLFANEGARTILVGRRLSPIESVAQEISLNDGIAEAISVDLEDGDAIDKFGKNVLEKHGAIDILVNNAGAVARLPVHELPVEEWDTVLNVNLRGLFLCTKYALIPMLSRKTGCIINISSGAGVSGPPNRSAYAASKHGVMGFTKVLVAEYLRKGIRSHVILPDATVSQMRSEGFPTEDPDSLIQADDIADAAVFLATQKITAHTMEVRVSQGLATRHTE